MEEPVWNVGAMLLPATLAVRSSCETMPSTAAVAAAAATPTACDIVFRARGWIVTARGLAVEAAGGTAVRAATAEAPREVKASMDDCNQDDNQLEDLRTRVVLFLPRLFLCAGTELKHSHSLSLSL